MFYFILDCFVGKLSFCFAHLATSCPYEQTKIYQLIFCNFYSEAYFCYLKIILDNFL